MDNYEQVVVDRKDYYGKVRIEMHKHGQGEVFIDDVKLERCSRVALELLPGKTNEVQLTVNSQEIRVSMERARILQDTMAFMKLEPHERVDAILVAREDQVIREIWEAHDAPSYFDWAATRSIGRGR